MLLRGNLSTSVRHLKLQGLNHSLLEAGAASGSMTLPSLGTPSSSREERQREEHHLWFNYLHYVLHFHHQLQSILCHHLHQRTHSVFHPMAHHSHSQELQSLWESSDCLVGLGLWHPSLDREHQKHASNLRHLMHSTILCSNSFAHSYRDQHHLVCHPIRFLGLSLQSALMVQLRFQLKDRQCSWHGRHSFHLCCHSESCAHKPAPLGLANWARWTMQHSQSSCRLSVQLCLCHVLWRSDDEVGEVSGS